MNSQTEYHRISHGPMDNKTLQQELLSFSNKTFAKYLKKGHRKNVVSALSAKLHGDFQPGEFASD